MGEETRYCTACGAALAIAARFCGGCGHSVAAGAPPAMPANPAPAAGDDHRDCPKCHQGDLVFAARQLADREFTKEEVAAAEEAEIGDPEAAQIFLEKPDKPANASLGFWLILPFIPVLNFLLCWMAPMRRGFKFFLGGLVLAFAISVAIPSLYAAGAYAFIGCIFIVSYYVGLLADRKRQQARLAEKLIPEYERALQRWEHLRYCQRCDISWLDSDPTAYVAVEESEKIL